jgi:hypothetical protein
MMRYLVTGIMALVLILFELATHKPFDGRKLEKRYSQNGLNTLAPKVLTGGRIIKKGHAHGKN